MAIACQRQADALVWPVVSLDDRAALAGAAAQLAAALPVQEALDDRFRVQLVAGDPGGAVETIRALRDETRAVDPLWADGSLVVFEVYAAARRDEAGGVPFGVAYAQELGAALARLDDKAAWSLLAFVREDLTPLETDLKGALAARGPLPLSEAKALVRQYQLFAMYDATLPLLPMLIAADDARRYVVEDHVVIETPHGVQLAAVVMRPRKLGRAPAAMFFSIYTDATRGAAREAAAHGYVGVAVESRGKRLATAPVAPYEHEADDVYDAIDWVAHQPWSDGQVGMWGNSYAGFAQWAAVKHRVHPALKTIVPSAAAIPGLGLPMENNIFLNANYGWAFYVTNQRLLDNRAYYDPARWDGLDDRWYASGRPYREFDQVDGAPNPWLQRWLAHPDYDAYWQAMVPYGDDYSHIDIPILTITGYFDDGQISALHYLREHARARPDVEHALLIGPYQHFSAQAARKPRNVGGYAIDAAAQINTKDVIFGWFDHVMRGAPRPAILADRINYEVMGGDRWDHAPSLAAMASETMTLYLNDHALTPAPAAGYVEQTIELADRSTSSNNYYPSPVVPAEISGGVQYVSAPLPHAVSLDGVVTGELAISIDRRDVDLSVVLYELRPDGQLVHLTYFLGRASYARDMTHRQLLTPNTVEHIPFDRTRLTSRKLETGSRLVVVVDVNKNAYAQINYGTGGDVSDESISDATAPLHIRWYGDSAIRLPIRPE